MMESDAQIVRYAGRGTVALIEAGARRSRSSGPVIRHSDSELSERVGEAGSRPYVGPEVVEASAQVLEEGMPCDDHARGAVSLQPAHRSESGLQTTVVGLEPVVRV